MREDNMENRQVVSVINDMKTGQKFISLSDLLLMLYKELSRLDKGSETFLYVKDLTFRLENMKDVEGK
jgi:hypothetical protein